MPSLDKTQRRILRGCILEALVDETGSLGGTDVAQDVRDYRKHPAGAPSALFARIGGLILTRFFVDPSKPNSSERRSLWQAISECIAGSDIKQFKLGTDPAGWNGQSDILDLETIVQSRLTSE